MKGIFLDFDGVIVDSLPIYFDYYQRLCQRYGKILPVADLTQFRHWYEPRWEKNFETMGFSQAEFDQICSSYDGELDYDRAKLFPGFRELLTNLGQRWPVAVVSTAPTLCIERRLRQEGLLDRIQIVVGSDDGSSEKNERLARAKQILGRSQGVMVGDTDLDIEAGKHNGLETVGVTYGWLTPDRVAEAGPTALVDEPEALEATLVSVLSPEPGLGDAP